LGARLRDAVGDGLDDADGPDSPPGEDAGPELAGHPEVPPAASASAPDVAQPSSVI
jgi:hypothetical protein